MSDWDDDDFDVDAKLDEVKENDEDMTIDDIEEAARKKAEAEALAAGKPKKKKKEEKEAADGEDCAYDVALQDPVAEKLRRQKLVEEADARMAADLFSGVDKAEEEKEQKKAAEEAEKAAEAEKAVKKEAVKAKIVVQDAFDRIKLDTQADVTNLLSTCLEKIETGKAKGSAQLFLTHLMKALVDDLSTEELKGIDTQLTGIVKDKKVEKTAADTAKRKTNEKMTKNTKFNISKETEDVYGTGEWGEEWDEEEWADDATAKEYAPPPKK